jgi:hypothetical protein
MDDLRNYLFKGENTSRSPASSNTTTLAGQR